MSRRLVTLSDVEHAREVLSGLRESADPEVRLGACEATLRLAAFAGTEPDDDLSDRIDELRVTGETLQTELDELVTVDVGPTFHIELTGDVSTTDPEELRRLLEVARELNGGKPTHDEPWPEHDEDGEGQDVKRDGALDVELTTRGEVRRRVEELVRSLRKNRALGELGENGFRELMDLAATIADA